MSHGDKVKTPPPGFVITGSTPTLEVAAMADESRKIYAVQFHPEVHHSVDGDAMLRNFLFKVCNIVPDWSMSSFVERVVKEMAEKIGDKHVVCALSGGIDSTVVAVLLHKAIGHRLHCIFVDNGLLRLNEGEEVVSYLREHFDLNLNFVQAQDRFLDLLKGVEDPEKKRKIIGHTFIDIFDEEARKLPEVEYLAQGTLYPDVIESVSHKGPSAVIKSHHNVGGLPETMKLKLVEPLRELFKDEVRKVAAELGMPDSIVWRHPFPGPGLAIRVLGEITEERLNILRQADKIVQEELRESGWYRKVWQGFAVLLWPASFVLPNALRAANDVRFTMVVSIASMAILRVGASWVLCVHFGMGAVGVWIAMVLDWICRTGFFVGRMVSGKWKTKYAFG